MLTVTFLTPRSYARVLWFADEEGAHLASVNVLESNELQRIAPTKAQKCKLGRQHAANAQTPRLSLGNRPSAVMGHYWQS